MAVKDKSGESSLKLSYEVRNFSDSGFRSETISGLFTCPFAGRTVWVRAVRPQREFG